MAWQIKSVSDDTIRIIKQKAKDRGLTIGQFLDWHFSGEIEVVGAKRSDHLKEYKLKLSPKTMDGLKRKAFAQGLSVSKYFEHITQENKNG